MHLTITLRVLILQMRNVLFLIDCNDCKNDKIDRQRYFLLKIIQGLKFTEQGHCSTLGERSTHFFVRPSALQQGVADLPPGWDLTVPLLHTFPLTCIGIELCSPLDLYLGWKHVFQVLLC